MTEDLIESWSNVSDIWRELYSRAERDLVDAMAGLLAWRRLQSLRSLVGGELTAATATVAHNEKELPALEEQYEKLTKQVSDAVAAVRRATENGYKRGAGVAADEEARVHVLTLKLRELTSEVDAVRFNIRRGTERIEKLSLLQRRIDTIKQPPAAIAEVTGVLEWLQSKKSR